MGERIGVLQNPRVPPQIPGWNGGGTPQSALREVATNKLKGWRETEGTVRELEEDLAKGEEGKERDRALMEENELQA